jgi:hypothetical protein
MNDKKVPFLPEFDGINIPPISGSVSDDDAIGKLCQVIPGK